MRGKWAKEWKKKKTWKMNWFKLFMVESQANQITCHCAPSPLQACTARQPACDRGAAAEGFLLWLVICCVFFFRFVWGFYSRPHFWSSWCSCGEARKSRNEQNIHADLLCFHPERCFWVCTIGFFFFPGLITWWFRLVPVQGKRSESHTRTSLSLAIHVVKRCRNTALDVGFTFRVGRGNTFFLYLSNIKAKGLRMDANQDTWLS